MDIGCFAWYCDRPTKVSGLNFVIGVWKRSRTMTVSIKLLVAGLGKALYHTPAACYRRCTPANVIW